jgi:hypothetical protein
MLFQPQVIFHHLGYNTKWQRKFFQVFCPSFLDIGATLSAEQEFGVYWSWRNKVREGGIGITFENLNSWNIIFKNLKYTIMQASLETKPSRVQNTIFVHHNRIIVFIQGESGRYQKVPFIDDGCHQKVLFIDDGCH